ncbi:sulfite exporter TauE/SafE family protein, partial [Enterococcus faecalis]
AVNITPVLDLQGFHSLKRIAFYSSVALLVMSISSTYKQYQNGVQIDWKKAACISFGSLVGGMVGDLLLNQAIALAPNE